MRGKKVPTLYGKKGNIRLGAKKMKIFSSVLQKATYVAGRGLKK
jgi:hypothetical protein